MGLMEILLQEKLMKNTDCPERIPWNLRWNIHLNRIYSLRIERDLDVTRKRRISFLWKSSLLVAVGKGNRGYSWVRADYDERSACISSKCTAGLSSFPVLLLPWFLHREHQEKRLTRRKRLRVTHMHLVISFHSLLDSLPRFFDSLLFLLIVCLFPKEIPSRMPTELMCGWKRFMPFLPAGGEKLNKQNWPTGKWNQGRREIYQDKEASKEKKELMVGRDAEERKREREKKKRKQRQEQEPKPETQQQHLHQNQSKSNKHNPLYYA